jgi:putative glutamine amidotransferase
MKPIIGVLAVIDNERLGSVQYPYVKAIEKSGGTPILLPYSDDESAMEHFVELCDGFFFTGGVDISPTRYGEEVKSTCGEIQHYRDSFEFDMINKVLKTEKPILAVCRGAQLVNIVLGGTLYQDIPSEITTDVVHRQTEPKFSFSHEINIVENTPFAALVPKGRIKANSFHHQAIKKLGKGLAVMATCDDGIIEAVYLESERYVRAYQWHPERLFDICDYNKAIFKDFVESCK